MTENWRSFSSCLNSPELFYKDYDEKWLDKQQAKDMCIACPVQANCVDYAIRAREPEGIWRCYFALSS